MSRRAYVKEIQAPVTLADARRALGEAGKLAHQNRAAILAECAAFLEASIIAGVPLFGVVAGEVTSPQHAANARRRYLRRSA